MSRLNEANLKRLMDILRNESTAGANRKDAAEDLESVRDALRSCVEYVTCVAAGENDLNFLSAGTEEYRDYVASYDAARHGKHENAISGASLLNRLSEWYRKEKEPGADLTIFTGDPGDRHQVAEFCLEVESKLFEGRRKIL